jgi:hypothetical protein
MPMAERDRTQMTDADERLRCMRCGKVARIRRQQGEFIVWSDGVDPALLGQVCCSSGPHDTKEGAVRQWKIMHLEE